MGGKVTTVNVDVKGFASLLDLAPRLIVRKLVLELFTKIVKRTPVDTGRARSSWQIAEGEPSAFLPPEIPKTKGQGRLWASAHTGAIRQQIGALAAAGPNMEVTGDTIVYITSNLVYIEPLEKGHSKQAPAGMVAISVAEVEAEIELLIEAMIEEALKQAQGTV